MFFEDENFLSAHPCVRHGFFGRRGGVGKGLYESLNIHPRAADDPAAVRENRGRVARALGGDPRTLLTVDQCHSADCITVEDCWAIDDAPAVDALVTDRPGIALGVMTADCAPVLLYGEKPDGTPVIAAAHAGWQGALKGVVENTVLAMEALGASYVRAAIGPCIQQASYEVDGGFVAKFLEQDSDNEHFFKAARKDGHAMFDLPGYVARRLAAAGVRHVSISAADTCADEENYFRFRRATHRGEADYGRQVSAIVRNT